jgi:hypothetical protein
MRIAFTVCRCGLANNGGSQSIVRMANALRQLNHRVMILSDWKNCFTWEKLHPSIFTRVPADASSWPDADVIISTGVRTIPGAIAFSETTGAPHWSWLRGWETWLRRDSELVPLYAHPNVRLMANSKWLCEHVARRTQKACALQYSGVPYERFTDLRKRNRKHLVIGGLAHFTKSSKRWSTFRKLAQRSKTHGRRNIYFVAMGDRPSKETAFLSAYISRPSLEKKVQFYNAIDIWVSTSVLEGLHIPPMEAGLCGAAIITPRTARSGTDDYAIHRYSALRYDPNRIDDLDESIIRLSQDRKTIDFLSSNLKSIVRTRIGSVAHNARAMERILTRHS